jgi:hypothetical protein
MVSEHHFGHDGPTVAKTAKRRSLQDRYGPFDDGLARDTASDGGRPRDPGGGADARSRHADATPARRHPALRQRSHDEGVRRRPRALAPHGRDPQVPEHGGARARDDGGADPLRSGARPHHATRAR